jgi:branched-chain amino acid transport system permease protein
VSSPAKAGHCRRRFFPAAARGFSRFFTEYYLIPVGIIFIAMVIFMPRGLLGFGRTWLNR